MAFGKWRGIMRRLIVLVLLLAGMGVGAQEAAIPRFTEMATIERGSGPIITGQSSEQMAFSPDGAYLAAGMAGGVGIWEIATGEIVRTLPQESFAVAWSPDGRWLTMGDIRPDGMLRLWDAETGELRGEFNQDGWDAGIYSSWSPDGSRFATDSGQVINPETGEITMQLGETWAIPNGALWSPDGKHIAIPTTWHDTFLHLYSADSGELVDTYWSESASWSPDGLRIATDGQIRDAATGLPTAAIPDLYGNIAWSPDGRWVVSDRVYGYYSADTIYAWDPATGELLTTLTIPGCEIRGMAWSADGSRLAASCFYYRGSSPPKIYVWDVGDGGEVVLYHPPESERWNQMPRTPLAADTRDGRYRAVDTGEDVRIYEMPAETLIDTLEGYALDVEPLPWSRDGSRLVVLARGTDSRHGPKYIWTVREGLSAPIYNATGQVWWLADDAEIVSVSDYSMLRFYDGATGELLRTVRGFPPGMMQLLDVNDKYLLTLHGRQAMEPTSVVVLSLETFEPVLTAPIGYGAAFIEDDRLFVTEPGPPGFTMEYDLTGQNAPVRRDE